MPNVVKEFDSYTVEYVSTKSDISLASVSCFNGNDWVGLLTFSESRSAGQEPSLVNGRIVLSFTIDRFSHVMDILRNEKPLQLYLNPAGKWGAVITKETEPVGEGE